MRAGAIAEMQRVLKPGGRMMIVEFGKARAASLLHPVALLHHRRAGILDGVVALMKEAGLERVATAPLGFAGLAYALGCRRYNCDPTDLLCPDEKEPSCPAGQVPTIAHGHYTTTCVPISSCRCEYVYECPHRERYECNLTNNRCEPVPPDAVGQ
jgi:hypothetical protein